jgi:hypothetical protein
MDCSDSVLGAEPVGGEGGDHSAAWFVLSSRRWKENEGTDAASAMFVCA